MPSPRTPWIVSLLVLGSAGLIASSLHSKEPRSSMPNGASPFIWMPHPARSSRYLAPLASANGLPIGIVNDVLRKGRENAGH